MSRISQKKSSNQFRPRTRRAPRWLSFLIVVFTCVGFVLMLLLNSCASTLPPEPSDELVTDEAVWGEMQGTGGDFSTFSHTNPMHSRLPCLLCHQRDDNRPRPRLPGHLPCSGCHTQQFNNPASPICTICHTNVQTGAVKAFPPLRSFNVRFDHARHAAGRSRPKAGCVACHRPLRGGVALSIPARVNAHATCFQCHTPRARGASGNDISSCSTCHRLGRYSRTPQFVRAFRLGFSHANHGAGQRLSCNNCHQVRAGMPQRRQVTSPAATQHSASAQAQSCTTCHNGKRAFGGDDFSSCQRCHQGKTFRF